VAHPTGPGRVTIVVMTRDRWPDLQGSLPRHEAPVILIDNGSTDGTPDLVRRNFPDVEVVELGSNHGSVARNIGVGRARTPYVAFADDDSWWAAGAVEQVADLFDAHPRMAVLAARMLVGEEEEPDPVCALMAQSPLSPVGDLPGPPGARFHRVRVGGAATGVPAGRRVPPGDLLRRRGDRARP